MNILGTKVDFLSKNKVLRTINSVIARRSPQATDEAIPSGSLAMTRTEKRRAFFIVTANPEFILKAQKDKAFASVLQKADFVLPDGIALFQARDFVTESGIMNHESRIIKPLFIALKIFLKTISGAYNKERITGVELVRSVIARRDDEAIPSGSPRSLHSLAMTKRVFLLGGHNGVAKILAEKYGLDYLQGPNDIEKITQKENEDMLKKIRTVKPDILFVSFGHFKQESWIAQNLDKIHAPIVIGVGSAFDETAAIGLWQQPVPQFFDHAGLKWLWRLLKNPRHIGRVWQAVIVFPWKVYKSAI